MQVNYAVELNETGTSTVQSSTAGLDVTIVQPRMYLIYLSVLSISYQNADKNISK